MLTLKFESFVPKGYRVGSFLFDPSTEIREEIAPGQNYETRVSIYYDGKEPLKISDFKTDKDFFAVRFETLDEGRRYSVFVKSSAQLAAGVHKQTVKLLTNLAAQPELELEFEVDVKAATSEAKAIDTARPNPKPKAKRPGAKNRKAK